MSTQRHIAIIGAGIAGLAAALDLNEAGHHVTIYEAAPQAGGLAAGFRASHWDWSLEKFYHHWFAGDRHMLGLIERLGWRDQVLFPRPYTVIYYQGKFYPLDSYVEAFKFTLSKFGPIDLVRFGLTGVFLKLTPRWQPLEQVTADAWMRQWAGDRIYNALWRPLLVGKFGEENLDVVNMAWLWARIHARTTRLGTFVGGFQAFVDKLADLLRGRGVETRLNTPVTQISRAEAGQAGRLTVTAAGDVAGYDAVISTSSPALMAKLAPDLPESYSASLRDLKSMGAIVLVVTLDRQLTQFYWHSLAKEAGFPYLAMVEHTNFIGPEHYGGDHILYLGDYLEVDHEYFSLSKEELLERFLPSLERFNPAFERSWVRESWLWKTAYAQPVPPVNHSQNIPPIQTPLPGLYFASMSQVYPWDRGTNYAVEIGQRAAGMVIEELRAGDS
ncbi:MAG TPA: NAD(P)/FAD-dependent oxidoreductase [Anaerolineae bacterium]|nr:NAD(P)/FAD-dependent oxidoreductase [Anaerolineae bacterium]HNU03558.1 NAD(P)/FAD-dependent oxidoreductase [Anaerolineae bacterium]